MSASIASVHQGVGTVASIGFYQPSFFPLRVALLTQGFWSIQLPTTQDVTLRVNIPSVVLATGLTLTAFSTCLMRNVRRPPFGYGHRPFNYTARYLDSVNATAASLAGIHAGSFYRTFPRWSALLTTSAQSQSLRHLGLICPILNLKKFPLPGLVRS